MNRKRSIQSMVAASAGCLSIALAVFAADKPPAEVPFPEGYRSWQHVKSVIAGPGSKGFATDGGKIYHFYANPAAVEGYRDGKFPNGAILVRETLHAVPGQGASEGVLSEGDRTALDVMLKDDTLFKDTAGWGFETFNSKSERLAEKDRAQCYACHSKQKDHDLVFTSLRTINAGVPYPTGYRHWTYLHSSLVPPTFDSFKKHPCEKPCTAGIFHFYANDKAMDGLRTGSYADGAIIAEEMLDVISGAGGSAREGQRRIVGVMVKDSHRYAATGGWGYASFDDDSEADQLDAAKREACYQCHVARKDQGYVFTQYRER